MACANTHWDNAFRVVLISHNSAFCSKINTDDAVRINICCRISCNHWFVDFGCVFIGGILILPEGPMAAVWVYQYIIIISVKVCTQLVTGKQMLL